MTTLNFDVIIILEKKIEIDTNFGAKIQSYHF